MDSGVNLGEGNHFPFMTFLGLDHSDKKFIESTKKIILESGLDHKSLTNGLVLELWSMVEIQDTSDKPISPNKISRRQFAEILGCFFFQWSTKEVTKDFIKNFVNTRDFKSLKMKVSSGAVSEHDIWGKGRKLFERVAKYKCRGNMGEGGDISEQLPLVHLEASGDIIIDDKEDQHMSDKTTILVDGAPTNQTENNSEDQIPMTMEENVENEEEPSQTIFCPHLSKLGILDFTSRDLVNFEEWSPIKEDVTNGVVIEIADNFADTKTLKVFIKKLCNLLNLNLLNLDHILERRMQHYIKRTDKKKCDLDDQWMFFETLEPGGKYFRAELVNPRSKFDEAVQNLIRSNNMLDRIKICSGCGTAGDLYCCQGCFSSFYCSEACQKDDWILSHKKDCPIFSAKIFGQAAKLPPPESSNLIGKYRRALQTRA